jgi:hypothetical protein
MGILWDRKVDGGRGQVKKTNVPLDGGKMHVSQYDKKTNSRTSWDTNGGSLDGQSNKHRTNQDAKKGRRGRH